MNAFLQPSSSRRRLATVETEAAALRLTLREYESTVRAQALALAACEAEVAAREAVVSQREASLAACEAVVAERERALAACQAEVAARETALGEQAAAIADLQSAVRGYQDMFRKPDSHALESAMDLPSPATPAPDPSAAWDAASSLLEGRRPSAANVDQALDEWHGIAARYAGQGFRGGQTLIEPYLIERRIHDRPGYLIMATKEGQDWYDNQHETEVPELLRLGMLRQGDTVFDCGSNQGLNALSYARAVGPAGRVVAFDPFPLHIDIARFNARLNDLRNIDFIRAGLSSRAEQLNVSILEQCVAETDDTADGKSISLLPLDAFASLRPSFVKLDIEGAEVDALEGAAEIIAMEPAIYIEVHPRYLPRFGKVPSDVFKHVPLSRYRCYIDHPGVPRMSGYEGEFEMTEGCALYCVPRSRDTEVRRLRASHRNV